MIDFKNASFIHLKAVDNLVYATMLRPILLPDEEIVASYKAMRDGIVFTTMRIITINVQGITGTKKDFTSLPYGKIQVFSVETAGNFDLDSELDLWFSGVGRIRFEFTSHTDIGKICRIISAHVL